MKHSHFKYAFAALVAAALSASAAELGSGGGDPLKPTVTPGGGERGGTRAVSSAASGRFVKPGGGEHGVTIQPYPYPVTPGGGERGGTAVVKTSVRGTSAATAVTSVRAGTPATRSAATLRRYGLRQPTAPSGSTGSAATRPTSTVGSGGSQTPPSGG